MSNTATDVATFGQRGQQLDKAPRKGLELYTVYRKPILSYKNLSNLKNSPPVVNEALSGFGFHYS